MGTKAFPNIEWLLSHSFNGLVFRLKELTLKETIPIYALLDDPGSIIDLGYTLIWDDDKDAPSLVGGLHDRLAHAIQSEEFPTLIPFDSRTELERAIKSERGDDSDCLDYWARPLSAGGHDVTILYICPWRKAEAALLAKRERD